MKVAILAGGHGTRLAEETEVKPKPMVEIGGRPILWHIMKIYDHYGFSNFVIALGYKGEVIKKYIVDAPKNTVLEIQEDKRGRGDRISKPKLPPHECVDPDALLREVFGE